MLCGVLQSCLLFFFNVPATTESYTLSLHDALPISMHTYALLAGCVLALLGPVPWRRWHPRSEEHTSELQSRRDLVCRLLLEKKKYTANTPVQDPYTTTGLPSAPLTICPFSSTPSNV